MKHKQSIKVWDPLVRLFHWLLVTAFFVAYVTEDDFMTLHVWAGYLLIGLLVFRVLWGLVGSRHARFSDFVYPPRQVLRFLKETFFFRAKRYLGHNPAGGAMIIVLLLSLTMTSLTGLLTYGVEEAAGPLAPWVGGTGEVWGEAFEEIHEFFANFTLLLVFIHVMGVLVESALHRENLVRAMLTGYKRAEQAKE